MGEMNVWLEELVDKQMDMIIGDWVDTGMNM